ncbi:MAG: Winged helix family transcriptional regulator [Enterococcus gilvus]|uniref:winged helix-turn-helix domain-containing protein n=1 Tax=Enterococcus gilvus TaxID=160453 RepID=UPI0039F53089
MTQILYLTKNILVERKMQEKLNDLNIEVYCSSRMLDELLGEEKSIVQPLYPFTAVLFSNTISNKETQQLIQTLSSFPLSYIRKVDRLLEEEIPAGIDQLVSENQPIDDLREAIYSLDDKTREYHVFELIEDARQNRILTEESIKELILTRNEENILRFLMSANGRSVSREEICKNTWGQEVRNSQLSQLSCIVRRLKEKLQLAGYGEDLLVTLWGKGYRLKNYMNPKKEVPCTPVLPITYTK